jgi:hypothetical protein
VLLHLSHAPFFILVIFQIGSNTYCLRMALNCTQSFYLHLPYSWDYRCDSLYLACVLKWEFANFLPGQASTCDPLKLCLPSNGDYRCVTPFLAPIFNLVGVLCRSSHTSVSRWCRFL